MRIIAGDGVHAAPASRSDRALAGAMTAPAARPLASPIAGLRYALVSHPVCACWLASSSAGCVRSLSLSLPSSTGTVVVGEPLNAGAGAAPSSSATTSSWRSASPPRESGPAASAWAASPNSSGASDMGGVALSTTSSAATASGCGAPTRKTTWALPSAICAPCAICGHTQRAEPLCHASSGRHVSRARPACGRRQQPRRLTAAPAASVGRP